jgi:hypothetical protein
VAPMQLVNVIRSYGRKFVQMRATKGPHPRWRWVMAGASPSRAKASV